MSRYDLFLRRLQARRDDLEAYERRCVDFLLAIEHALVDELGFPRDEVRFEIERAGDDENARPVNYQGWVLATVWFTLPDLDLEGVTLRVRAEQDRYFLEVAYDTDDGGDPIEVKNARKAAEAFIDVLTERYAATVARDMGEM